MRPLSDSPTCAQCSPPSVERYTPFPIDTFDLMNASPVPAQTTFGSEGAIASAPIDWASWSSKSGLHE